MDFELTTEQLAIQNMAKEFAAEEFAPNAKQWDEESIFPVETLRKAAQLGMGGIFVKSDMGGSELDRIDAAIIFEELASGCVSTAAYLSIHNMVGRLLDNYANDNLRQKYLPKLCTMEYLSSYCLTEPNAGSDAAALTTTAEQTQTGFILNGTKAFISGGSMSDVYLVMARTGGSGPKGISCFLVENNTPGLSFGKKEDKLGWRSQPTTMVNFDNCEIPSENQIGELGQGFNIALNALNGGRVNIAACSLGGAKACLEYARNYMTERSQFGKRLSEFEALQFRLADMATEFEAAQLLVFKAAHMLHQNHPSAPKLCAMAKRYATDIGFSICNQALQIYGGYGYLKEYPIERYVRDLRVHQILEGTNEIMRLIIARNIFN